MLEANGSALVSGERVPADTMVWVEAVRGFYFDGTAHPPGTRVAVPSRFGKELVALGKAKWSEAPAPMLSARPLLKLTGSLQVASDEAEPKRKGPRYAVK